jgi:hypothetical protein
MEALRGIPNLEFGRDVAALVRRLMHRGVLPPKARMDAAHVAVAAVNGMDFLVTWNLRHPCECGASWQDRRGVPGGRNRAADHLHTGRTHGAGGMKRRDPIVDEVRKHRAAIAREHGNDVDAIIAAFRREDAADTTRMTVSFPPKRVARPRSRSKAGTTRRPNKRLQPSAARQER